MRQKFAILTAVVACLFAGRMTQAQQFGPNAPQGNYWTPQVVQPVAYQTSLDDEDEPRPTRPTRSRTTSASGSVSAAAPVGYQVSQAPSGGCACGAGCGVNAGCGANAGCASKGCGANTSCSVNDNCLQCQDGCQCGLCRNRGAISRMYGGVEYLFWWSDARAIPVLATTSPLGTPAATAGVLGQAGTTNLFGGGTIGGSNQSGARFTIGMWLDDEENLAAYVRGYTSEGEVNRFNSDPAMPIVARPFFNDDPLVNAQDALLVTYPGLSAGTIGVVADNDVYGLEANLRSFIDGDATYRMDVLYGAQYNRISDNMTIQTNTLAGANAFALTDVFNCKNDFYAGSVGLMGEFNQGILTLNALAKISVGDMKQKVLINGSNTVTVGGIGTTTPGGLLAQPVANMGTHERDVLAFAPEAGINLSLAVTRHMDFTVGYTFVYWTNVATAGRHIDNNVNGTQLLGGGPLVGPATPAFAFASDQFWMQALSLGANFRY